MVEMAKKILVITAIIFLVVGYFFNLTFILVRASASVEIYLLLFMILYTLTYVLCWLLLLFAGLKRNSKKLLNLYQIFWLVTATFLILSPLIPPGETSLLEGISVFGWLIFVAPLVGLDGLVFYIGSGYLYAANFYAALTISLAMSLLGFLARWRLRLQAKTLEKRPTSVASPSDI
jgi:hypothetical protein